MELGTASYVQVPKILESPSPTKNPEKFGPSIALFNFRCEKYCPVRHRNNLELATVSSIPDDHAAFRIASDGDYVLKDSLCSGHPPTTSFQDFPAWQDVPVSV